jgi:hypothetical protein
MSRSARVQKIIDEAASLTPAERAELAEELSKPLVFTKEDWNASARLFSTFWRARPSIRGPLTRPPTNTGLCTSGATTAKADDLC